MTVSLHVSGVTRTIASINVRDAANVSRAVAVGKARDATNVPRLFTGSLSVALSSDEVGGRVNTSLSVAIQTFSVDAIPTGGAEPYSYLWERTDSDPGTWTINSPTGLTTNFTGGNCGPGESLTATFHCTVTDHAGNVVTTGDVTATVYNISFNISGGGGPLP